MTLQFKTLDQTIQTFDPATRTKTSVQKRCAEIDKLVPQMMG
jgi:hypothetical protein